MGSVSGEDCSILEAERHLTGMGPLEGQSIKYLSWPEADSFPTKPQQWQIVAGQDPDILLPFISKSVTAPDT